MLLKLAWRNVFRQKRRTILTLLTMTGGFFLSSLSIGWMDGSYSSIIMFFTNNRTGQIQVHCKGYLQSPSIYSTVNDYQAAGVFLDSIPGVRAWAPRIYSGALLAVRPRGAGSGNVFTNSAAASVIGIDPVMEEAASGFSSQIESGEMLSSSAADTSYSATGQIILGKELSIILEASAGDSLVMLTQAADGSSADRMYVIRGIVSTGNANIDRNTCYITLSDAQILFALQGKVHEIAVMTGSLGAVDELTAKISAGLSGENLETDSWKTFAREFYNGMKADEASLKVMIFVIVLVAAMGVLNTILMMVLERRREFGVMKAIGTRPGFIVRMIVLEANIMGIISVIAGGILSTAGLLFLSEHGFAMDPPLDYGGTVFREMIASITPECYWIPAICVIITASTVSFLPALKAAHTKAAKTLRTV
ncbi:MAG: FtsX-like permease family protein [Candidatus Aegiribacteria sp.]|nr:FtsX-like permease family protein [Candidatus Aegiribacteria sp.]